MMTDLRFALRQLRKSPGFTLLAVITLTLGIGLNTAIFSLINDLFLRVLPFSEPERIVHITAGDKARDLKDFPLGAPRFMHYRDGQTIFSRFAGENGTAFTLTGLGDAVLLPAFRVTSNYFDVLGVRPILGRDFLPQEEETADVALVTENFWRKRLGGDPNVIGRSITLDGAAHSIVGVLPDMPVVWSGPNAEVWTTKPFQILGFSHERMMRGTGFLRVIGRLKPGVTVAIKCQRTIRHCCWRQRRSFAPLRCWLVCFRRAGRACSTQWSRCAPISPLNSRVEKRIRPRRMGRSTVAGGSTSSA